MKTFIRGLLTTVLVFTFTLIPTVIYAEKTVNKDLIGDYFKEVITSQMTETITSELPDLTEEEYQTIEDNIENNEEINDFVEKYSSRLLQDLSKENIDDVDLEEDIRNILYGNKEMLEETLGEEITDEQIDQALDEAFATEGANNAYQQIIKETRDEMPAEAQAMIDSYNTITSNEFIIIAVIVSVVAIIIIALLKKPYYKWIVNVGIAGIISALFIALIGASISLLFNLVIESMNTTMTISALPMLITAGIMLVVSIILIIINSVLDNKQERKNAVS